MAATVITSPRPQRNDRAAKYGEPWSSGSPVFISMPRVVIKSTFSHLHSPTQVVPSSVSYIEQRYIFENDLRIVENSYPKRERQQPDGHRQPLCALVLLPEAECSVFSLFNISDFVQRRQFYRIDINDLHLISLESSATAASRISLSSIRPSYRSLSQSVFSYLSVFQSITSIRKLTGRKPSLHDIIAEAGFFIHPS